MGGYGGLGEPRVGEQGRPVAVSKDSIKSLSVCVYSEIKYSMITLGYYMYVILFAEMVSSLKCNFF